MAYFGGLGAPDLPHIVFSDDGVNWSQPFPTTNDPWRAAALTCPLPNPATEQILAAPGWVPFASIDHAIAADPMNPDTLYMVFPGMTTGLDTVDLFVARSTDGGATWPFEDVLHLRDVEDLGVQPGDLIHQVMPSVTVDQRGGINIAYYAASNTSEDLVWDYQARYARIKSFGTCPRPTVAGFALTPVFNVAVEGLGASVPNNWMGDYIMMDSRGCEVYVGFMSRHEGGPYVNVYASKINVCTDADVDNDAALTSADVTAFAGLFAAGDPRADLARNGHVDLVDLTHFLESFSCGCNP